MSASEMLKPFSARRWEIMRLAFALVVMGSASLDAGVLWAAARVSPLSRVGYGLLFALPIVAVYAGVFVARRLLHSDAQKKKAEAGWHASESRFRDSFEQFPLSLQIVQHDGFTSAVNLAWETMFGDNSERVKTQNLLADPALRDNGVVLDIQAALAGRLVVLPVNRYNIGESWPNSSHDPNLNLWIKAMMCPIKDDDGRVLEMIIIHEDVTEQMEARAALLESEARKSAIIESAFNCIVSIDDDGAIIEWNPAAENTFGFSRSEALGRLPTELIIPVEWHEAFAAELQSHLENSHAITVGQRLEVLALHADGHEFPIELAITSVIIDEKRIATGFMRDLTESKAAQQALQEAHAELESRVVQRTAELRAALEELQRNYERLEQLESLRDTLTGMIVHDLRTPLNSMLLGLQTVSFLGAVNPAQQECLDVFALGCKDSLSIINDLLDLGKMESGLFALDVEACDVAALVERALENVEMLAKIKNLQLVAQVAADLPTLSADPEKVGRLLVNLLSNAIKFVPSDGTITLGAELSPDESAIWFWVRDNGVGIPPEAFQRIFEKFGQADSRLGARETSSGLGLTFCKMIVEAHGGKIWVESEPEKGSVFTATFPLTRK